MLSPAEFGTIALLLLFTGLASVVLEGGFSSALIQRQDATPQDEATVFWLNAGFGVMFVAGMYVSAPWLATFYGQPVLEPLARVMSLAVLITAVGSVPASLLTKNLDFRTQARIAALSTLAAGVVAIGLALAGAGVWALAAQTLVSCTLSSAMLWRAHKWAPSAGFSKISLRRLAHMGGYLLASGVLGVVADRLYTVLIGKLYGPQELGYYTRAEGTRGLPVSVLASVLSRLSLPVFSAAAGDLDRLQGGVKSAVRVSMLINVSAMFFMFAMADPLIKILFGDKWLPAVPYLRVLCLAGLLWPLHIINLNVLAAQGHAHLFFGIEVVKRVIGIVLLLTGALYGPLGIAWSQVMFSAVAFIINAHYSGKYLKYGAPAQIADFGMVFLLAGAIFGVALDWQVARTPHVGEQVLWSCLAVAGFLLVIWAARVPGTREIFARFSRNKSASLT